MILSIFVAGDDEEDGYDDEDWSCCCFNYNLNSFLIQMYYKPFFYFFFRLIIMMMMAILIEYNLDVNVSHNLNNTVGIIAHKQTQRCEADVFLFARLIIIISFVFFKKRTTIH